jgi:potassium channel subfamily K
MTANMPEEVFVDDTTRAKQKILDAANELLHQAKTFHDHIHFFSEQQKYGASPSPALAKLLSDMAETEHMNEALKKEVLQDQDARTVSLLG